MLLSYDDGEVGLKDTSVGETILENMGSWLFEVVLVSLE